MKLRSLTFVLLCLFSIQFAVSQNLVGDWEGKLAVSGIKLTLVFHITDDDGLKGTVDSPDQGAFGIPAGPITLNDKTVVIKVPSIGGTFEGIFSNDTLIAGSWRQGATNLPLSLSRKGGELTIAPKRPQEPKPPFAYHQEEVEIKNEKAGVTLAGTLTIPEGDGPFPATILVSGSGPQDRDEALLGHKPFLVLADYLTRNGIAVLRYDDRGVAKSTGNFGESTSADFAEDAEAVLNWLQKHPKINGEKNGHYRAQ